MTIMSHACAVPILTYHSIHVDGADYASNDHIGLAEDLELIHALGWQVIGLNKLVQELISGDWTALPQRSVAITLDDGSWFDWSCMIGLDWWRDDWWQQAHAEGLLQIVNHSWDHRHAALPTELRYRPDADYGNFEQLVDAQECDWQIRQTQVYLQQLLGRAPVPVFAYPYGDVSEIVAAEYLPEHGESMGLHAAVSTLSAPVTPDSDRWRLPRYVFRKDWHSGEELQNMLMEISN
jgi:peptidoglycan/xylan/chitin deacetylase (PgdA/CDA1 family)